MPKNTSLAAITLAASTFVAVFGQGAYAQMPCANMLGATEKGLEKAARYKETNPDLKPFPDCGLEWYLRGFNSFRREEEQSIARLVRYSRARGYPRSQAPYSLPVFEAVNFELARSQAANEEDFYTVASIRSTKGQLLFSTPLVVSKFVNTKRPVGELRPFTHLMDGSGFFLSDTHLINYLNGGGSYADARQWKALIATGQIIKKKFLEFAGIGMPYSHYSQMVAYKRLGRKLFDEADLMRSHMIGLTKQHVDEIISRPDGNAFSGKGIIARHYFGISDGYLDPIDPNKRDVIAVFDSHDYNGGFMHGHEKNYLSQLRASYNVFALVAEKEERFYQALNSIKSMGREKHLRLLLFNNHANNSAIQFGDPRIDGFNDRALNQIKERYMLDMGDMELAAYLKPLPKDMVIVINGCASGEKEYPGMTNMVDWLHYISGGKTVIGASRNTSGLAPLGVPDFQLNIANPEKSRFVEFGGKLKGSDKDYTYMRSR